MKRTMWRWALRASLLTGLLLQTTTPACNIQDFGNALKKIVSIGFLLGVGT